MKLIREGQVAVIVSPGYGAGWSTWGDRQSCFDGQLAQAILDKEPYPVLEEIASKNWPSQYQGGLKDCRIQWIPVGTRFEIEEYDGSESLRVFGPDDGMVA